MKSPYTKYKNPDKRCWYPFEPDPFGYCYGYASMIDKKAEKDEIIAMCKGCEYWHEKGERK